MSAIEFAGLKLKNFRSLSEASLSFPPGLVHITGDNAKAKSTMAEAVIFALYGVTVTGSTKCDDLIKQGTESAAVELGLSVVGKPHTVARTKNKSENGSKVWIDGVKSNQNGVLRLVGLDQKEFLSVFNPSYFLAWVESDQKGAQDFFTRLLPKLNPIELTAKLSQGFRDDLDEDMLSDINGNLTKLKRQADDLESKKNFLAGQVSETERQLLAPEPAVEDDAPIRARLAELAQLRSTVVIPDRPAQPVTVDVAVISAQISQMRVTHNTLKGQIQRLPGEPEKVCVACGQDLAGEAMEKAVATWQGEKTRMSTANTAVWGQLGKLSDQIKALEEHAAQAERKNAEQTEAYPKAVAEWDQQTAKARNDLRVVDEETAGLQVRLGQVTAQKEAKKKRDESRARLTDLEKQQSEIEAKSKTLTNQVNALTQASKAAAEMLAEQIAGYLDHLSLQIFKVTKETGEVKPVFKLLYDGKPTPFLSFSERILAGMELSRLVVALRGITVPVFIDNKESISVLPDLGDRQVFLAEVIQGQELQVLDEAGYLALLARLAKEAEMRSQEEPAELEEPTEQVA
ncbi:MAG TPA: AAA family ATPase [Spirochaetia bacterium]|nr:AAA family ATPase [Spirochaetia bacterium]